MDWTDRYPNRFKHEKAVVKDRFYEANPTLMRHEGKLAWTLDITKQSGTTYKVVVAYPENYPHQQPETYVVKPKLVPGETKHMFTNGELCLFDRDGREWDVDRSTAATVIAWAATWLTAYEIWKRTGNWPGDEKEH